MTEADNGSIITVTGRIDPDELGITLPHEHFFIDHSDWIDPPSSAFERSIAREEISLENLWWVRRNPGKHPANMRAASFDIAQNEVELFRRAGGSSIVDVTSKHRGGDPKLVRDLSQRTGVNFIHGTAHYPSYSQNNYPNYIAKRSIDELKTEFVSDVRNGIDDTAVRAGIIGEIGVTGARPEEEDKVLRAGARAARETGTALTIHPPPNDQGMPRSKKALTVLDTVEEEGLDLNRVIICHMDSTWYEDFSYHEEIANRGAYVEYDHVGREKLKPANNDGMPSDKWRLDAVKHLVDSGHLDKILLSHDNGQKITRTAFGGPGYDHLLSNIEPFLHSYVGLTEDDVNQLLVGNPQRFLTVQESSS